MFITVTMNLRNLALNSSHFSRLGDSRIAADITVKHIKSPFGRIYRNLGFRENLSGAKDLSGQRDAKRFPSRVDIKCDDDGQTSCVKRDARDLQANQKENNLARSETLIFGHYFSH